MSGTHDALAEILSRHRLGGFVLELELEFIAARCLCVARERKIFLASSWWVDDVATVVTTDTTKNY